MILGSLGYIWPILPHPWAPLVKSMTPDEFGAQAQIQASAPAASNPERIKHVLAPTPRPANLSEDDFKVAAKQLGVSVEIIHAYAEVESGGRHGFGSNGLPKIAYEGHIFRRLTLMPYDRHNKKAKRVGKYDEAYPYLSYPYVQKAGPEWRHNNKTQATAWQTLGDAMALDYEAALQSCSWGMFQVMGFNYGSLGYKSIDEFVDDMKDGERGQLQAFVRYCQKKPGLVTAMKNKDYATMARLYNGDDYGNYDKLIEKSYKKHGGT